MVELGALEVTKVPLNKGSKGEKQCQEEDLSSLYPFNRLKVLVEECHLNALEQKQKRSST